MSSVKPITHSLPRLLQVIRNEVLLPSLQRITLTGDALQSFPLNRNGSHIKVFLPHEDQQKPPLPTRGKKGTVWPENEKKPITRTYSVSRYHQDSNELDIDFVIHGRNSPASGWAQRAKPGDFLGIAGPGGPHPLIAPAHWHLIAGDMSAFPAIAALLEDLPTHSEGLVFIETDNPLDIHCVNNNTQMQVQWLVRNRDESLLEKIKSIIHSSESPTTASSMSAFIAGENHAVFSIRDFLRETCQLSKKQLYAVPYWCRGQNEEQYHQQRHRIMDEVY